MERFLYTTLVLCFFIVFNKGIQAQENIPSPEKQIKAAVTPISEDKGEEATVLGYSKEGELVVLQEGSNEFVCLADDPKKKKKFHVACYHKDLEPFMKRGRELRREGKSNRVDEIRKEEIESGEIPMPRKPMALYSLTGKGNAYDYSEEELRKASPLYVIYVPYETVRSTGIAPRPVSDGAPWLMNPGEPWAHIMVSTGKMLGSEK